MDVAPVAQRRRCEKKAARGAAAARATIPEDVVLEILGRVADAEDVVTLFRCATACKRWRDLVSDPSFLRDRRPHPSSSLLFGFFAQQRPYRPHTVSADPIIGARSPAFVPAPQSPLGPDRRSLGSFIPCVADNLDFDDAEPLFARHSLLLVRLAPRRGVPADDVVAGRTLVRLAVCNLLAGTCDVLPPLKCRASSRINKCAILTHTDSCSNGQSPSSPLPTFSQVLVLVYNGGSRNYNLCTFSSADWSWSPPPRNCFSDPELRVEDGSAVICEGMARWLVRDELNFYTLEVGTDNSQFFLRDLPAPPGHHDPDGGIPLLSVAIDGTLSMLLLDVCCCWLQIWTLQGGKESGSGDDDDDVVDVDWICTKEIELKPPKLKHMPRLYVGERSSTLLVMDTLIRCVCFVDIETGAVHEETDNIY
ncbi:hypothetical protein ACQ4PT_024441 [Festuca glaucescens]